MEKELLFCETCKQDKPIEEFRLYRLGTHTKKHYKKCLLCMKVRRRETNNLRRSNNRKRGITDYSKLAPETKRNQVLRRYNLSQKGYEKILKDQNGVCYMCKLPSQGKYSLHVDHNHATGKVRKILCHRCNNGLRFVEDETFLARALMYLAEHKEN